MRRRGCNVRLQPALAKGFHDDAALPVGIEPFAHVLGSAPAAGAEVAAERGDSIRAGGRHKLRQAFAGKAHPFARQRKGGKARPRIGPGDAVALRAQARNVELGARRDHVRRV